MVKHPNILDRFSSDQISKLQNRKVSEWTPAMIETGLIVSSSMSSSAYKNLTKLSSVALPSFSTLHKKVNYRCPPGMLQIFIQAMKRKVFDSKTRHVALIFDETSICQIMRIDRTLTYICGNISKQFSNDNSVLKPAKKVLLFLLKDFQTNKKCPIAYFFTPALLVQLSLLQLRIRASTFR